MAGAPGFEPGNGGTKNRCLTAWLRPIEAGAPFIIGSSAEGNSVLAGFYRFELPEEVCSPFFTHSIAHGPERWKKHSAIEWMKQLSACGSSLPPLYNRFPQIRLSECSAVW